jgi:anaerobic selenocysteine-containing dehydrogenase
MLLIKAILNGEPYPVRAMLIAGANPMVTFPSVRRQGEALQNLDFLAVFDLFMTPTAHLADLVIPGADQLDNLELHEYGRIGIPYLGLMRPATSSPKGWPTWKLVFELARNLGLGDLFPWEDNRQALAYRLTGTTVTLSDLEGSESSTAAYHVDNPSSERWHTKDGKVHYRSDELDATGNPALPIPEAIDLPEQSDGEYPFWLSTGDRVSAYQHGQFRGIPVYEKMVPEPVLDIHPNAAARVGIQSGELVALSTPYGRIDIRAYVTPEVREDCLRMTHGWEQGNANELTGLEHFDAVSGFPWLKALPGKVERKESP